MSHGKKWLKVNIMDQFRYKQITDNTKDRIFLFCVAVCMHAVFISKSYVLNFCHFFGQNFYEANYNG